MAVVGECGVLLLEPKGDHFNASSANRKPIVIVGTSRAAPSSAVPSREPNATCTRESHSSIVILIFILILIQARHVHRQDG